MGKLSESLRKMSTFLVTVVFDIGTKNTMEQQLKLFEVEKKCHQNIKNKKLHWVARMYLSGFLKFHERRERIADDPRPSPSVTRRT